MRVRKGLEFVSVARGDLDPSRVRRNDHHIKHVFEDALDVPSVNRYRIEQVFVEHVFQEVLVSALTLLPTPRLRVVSTASSATSEREAVCDEAAVGPRPHLRLVTDDFMPEESRAERAIALPAELFRRPAVPRAARAGQAGRPERTQGTQGTWRAHRGGRSVRVSEAHPADLAPMHPAVRAQRRRRLEAQRQQVVEPRRRTVDEARSKVVRGTGVASPRRDRDSVRALPVGLRRLVAVSGSALALALVIAIGIVVSGLVGAPARTTTATVQVGQSLWEVAADTGAGDVDTTMVRIVELNGLESSALEPGQVLVVPAE